MRRSRVGAKMSASVSVEGGEQGFWPSYADMMSAVALVLFFLMLLAYIQNLITGNQLLSTEQQLESTMAELNATLGQVQDAQNELATLTGDLENVRSTLAEEQEQLTQAQDALQQYENIFYAQQIYIYNTQQDLENMKSQMQKIALLRLEIIDRIKAEIETVLGESAQVSIATNGNLILGENLLFDYNSDRIKTDGKSLLNALAESFSLFLSNPDNRQYVDSIVISGHTDSTGSASYNRDLSTRRANAVVNHLLENNSQWLSGYESFFSAAGYGATRPEASNDTDEGRQKNRRIEISLILKDETVLQIVDDYLNKDLPNATLP